MKKVIRIGDPTSHGGTVLSGSPYRILYKKNVARMGDIVSCPQNGHTNCVIIEGDPSWLVDGKPVALEGHLTSCGAVLFSTLKEVDRSYEGAEAASTGGGVTAAAKKLTTQVTPKFDEQIRFFWPDRNVMAETRYKLTLADGSFISGTTDAAGKTKRIETETEQEITCAEIFPEQLFCCANHAEQLCALGGQAPTPQPLSIVLAMQGISTNSAQIGTSVVQHTVVPESSRALTMGEIEMATHIFKDSINYTKVKVHKGGLFGIPSKQNTAITPNGEIHFPAQAYFDDFSTVAEHFKIWFIHELVHVWQYQLGYKVVFFASDLAIRGGYSNDGKAGAAPAYRYDLNGKDINKTLSQFNMEQQAELISHYFDALYLAGNRNTVAHTHNQEKLKQLSKALGSFRRTPKDPSLLPTSSAISP